jgi:hypothetical protein
VPPADAHASPVRTRGVLRARRPRRASWPQQRWIDEFTAEATTFAMLPHRLTRPVIRGACRRAAESPAEARRAFLAVMAWGYGRVGYGPFRVRRLLDAAPDAGAELQAAASALREAGPVAAYARLGNHGVARPGGPRSGLRHQVPLLLLPSRRPARTHPRPPDVTVAAGQRRPCCQRDPVVGVDVSPVAPEPSVDGVADRRG